MKVVEEYIKVEGPSIDLGVKYNVSSGLLRSWTRMYNANRELKDYNPKQKVYMAQARGKTTLEERKEIVAYCISHNRDYKNTAAKYDVSYSQVYFRVKKYDANGEAGLADKLGGLLLYAVIPVTIVFSKLSIQVNLHCYKCEVTSYCLYYRLQNLFILLILKRELFYSVIFPKYVLYRSKRMVKEMTIGKNIRNTRKEKRLTQKQLGERCQINEVQIRQYG